MQIIDKLHIWQGTEPSAFILLIDFDNLWPLFGTVYINSGYHRDVIWYQNGVIFHLVMPQKLWATLSETAKYKIFCFYLFRGYSSTSVRLNSTGNKHSINVEFNFPMYSWKMCFPLNSSTLQWNHVFHKLCGKLFSTVVQC